MRPAIISNQQWSAYRSKIGKIWGNNEKVLNEKIWMTGKLWYDNEEVVVARKLAQEC